MVNHHSHSRLQPWRITASDLEIVLSEGRWPPDLADEFVRRVTRKLTNYGRYRRAHHDVIEDAVQETLVRIIAHRDRLSTYTNVDGWVIAVFVNQTRDVIRLRGKVAPIDEHLLGSAATPERLLLNREQRSNALRAWYALSPIDRDLLRGAASGRRIASATAARVGLSPDRARHRLMDARRRLWRALYPDAQPPQLRREKKFFGRR